MGLRVDALKVSRQMEQDILYCQVVSNILERKLVEEVQKKKVINFF